MTILAIILAFTISFVLMSLLNGRDIKEERRRRRLSEEAERRDIVPEEW